MGEWMYGWMDIEQRREAHTVEPYRYRFLADYTDTACSL